MNTWDVLVLALRQIGRNKSRAALTCLGVVIGVAAVVMTVHIGQAVAADVTSDISDLGQNMLTITPGMVQRGPGGTRQDARAFELSDSKAIKQELNTKGVAPTVNTSATVIFGNVNWVTLIVGSHTDIIPVREWTIANGRCFDTSEQKRGARVCVIGATVAKELFDSADPVGSNIRVNRVNCRVIGVLAAKGQTMGQDQDDTIIMPLKTVQRRMVGKDDVSAIYVTAPDGQSEQLKNDITQLLRQRRKLGRSLPDDFSVLDMKEIIETIGSTTKTLTLFVACIAAISCLVGGIGIMNIMLVSVTERTREIGIRIAIGALRKEVLRQFLTEAVLLSSLGGVFGCLFGLAVSWLTIQQLELQFFFQPEVLVLSVTFSMVVGVAFGYLPAVRASQLNPIEALRYE